eukprot:TRINITY_DN890_c0_g1_i2.p1 TRINITY_DN890_c0_g1~~TRINITY_DN890_c0_g1_i2.p1  ORF type:complete len:610 (+),score=167.02 TRINITY_DN890_c0_g1_i2:260-2089(+)
MPSFGRKRSRCRKRRASAKKPKKNRDLNKSNCARKSKGLKKRREEREMEKLLMEEARAQQEREAALAENADYDRKEEEFHIEQAKKRSELRIEAGREKPVDILAKNLSLFSAKTPPDPNLPMSRDVELLEPYAIFEGLELRDLTDFQTDIQTFLDLGGPHKAYWEAILLLCQEEIHQHKNKDRPNTALLPSVQSDLVSMLQPKSHQELSQLRIATQRKIERADRSGEAIDVEFWEFLLKKISVYEARAYLREFHIQVLEKRLEQLKVEAHKQMLEQRKHIQQMFDSSRDVAITINPTAPTPSLPTPAESNAVPSSGSMEMSESKEAVEEEAVEEIEDDDMWEEIDENELEEIGKQAASVSYSPPLIPFHGQNEDGMDNEPPELLLDPSCEIVDPIEDMAQLEVARRKVLEVMEKRLEEKGEPLVPPPAASPTAAPSAYPTGSPEASSAFFNPPVSHSASSAGAFPLADDEAPFGLEVPIPDQPYWWHDKYRPRKPRFFNRVKTGYEWNKYNQTHYDHDNPPPKIVQGYKFNIFYPDLIDPTRAPYYVLEPAETPDYCIIRFVAGAPYEDIAFKIVHKEWEFSHRRGFKCMFDRGVLQLWFNFKRYRWRR